MIYEMFNNPEMNKIGGKAYNLVKLKKSGFNVPPFIVLTTEFFFDFLSDKREELKNLLEKYDQNSLKDIRNLIKDLDFKSETKTTLLRKLKDFFGEKSKIAIRSSATDEDGEENSFAGMMESYLNVEVNEGIFYYIKNVFLSCFSDRAMLYRKKHGLINPEISMAVVLQLMVDADVSGVMFTSNPLTNNPDEILISTTEGLGEHLVSGEKDGFDAVVDIFGNVENADIEHPLGNEKLVEISKIGLKIEDLDAKKRARDIEFCIKNNEIFILQDRMITPYRHIDKRKFRTILDNSNIIESYSGVTTPLTFTFAREVYEKIYRQTLSNFYISQEDINSISEDLKNMICFYENKIYYRLNSWYKMTSLYPGYNKNKRYMENMMGVKVELKENKKSEKFRLFKIYIRFIYRLFRMKKDSKKFIEKFEKVTSPYMNNKFEGYDNKSLLEIYRNIEKSILDDFTTPIINDMGAMVFLGKLTEKLKKKNLKDHEGLLGKIMSKQGNVESVKQSLSLMEIVNKIWDDKELLEEFRRKDIKTLISQRNDGREINSMINKYIDLYGSRVMDELKLETVTLHQDPRFLFQTIKNYLEMDSKVPVYQIEEIDESQLYRYFTFIERMYVKNLVNITKFFVKNRELLRLRRTYIYSIVRNIFLRIGNNFADKAVIDDYQDVFFMNKDDIFNIIEINDYSEFEIKSQVTNNRRIFEENKGKKIYERMYFYGDLDNKNMIPIFTKQEVFTHEDNVLHGVAGGGGIVEGIVKYVTDPSDANVDGYILMAGRTDPGWTVIFPMAKAIIIERGSVLSHSAVIAREMGLTLVVGIRGLTDMVKDGDKVRVDGIKGTVELLERNHEK